MTRHDITKDDARKIPSDPDPKSTRPGSKYPVWVSLTPRYSINTLRLEDTSRYCDNLKSNAEDGFGWAKDLLPAVKPFATLITFCNIPGGQITDDR